jgi:hypothetical protein
MNFNFEFNHWQSAVDPEEVEDILSTNTRQQLKQKLC